MPFIVQLFLLPYAIGGWIFAFCMGFFVKVFLMGDRSLVAFILYAFLGGLSIGAMVAIFGGSMVPFALIFVFMVLGAVVPEAVKIFEQAFHQSKK